MIGQHTTVITDADLTRLELMMRSLRTVGEPFRGQVNELREHVRRSRLVPVVESCLVEKDVFASELVIRAYRAGLEVTEIPVRVVEKRPPSINLFKRVPNVLKSVAKLTWAIRVRG